jgi:hypothetical protein
MAGSIQASSCRRRFGVASQMPYGWKPKYVMVGQPALWPSGLRRQSMLTSCGSASRRTWPKSSAPKGPWAAQLLDPGVVIPGNAAASREAALEAALVSLPCDKAVGRRAIANFFSKMGPERTQYVAQLVDGTYTFLALSVHQATREYVRSQIQPLKLSLDTNFIFGLLDLHSNVLGDASRELDEVIRSNSYPFTLYYHEDTLEEIRRTIGGIGRNLSGRHWPQGIAGPPSRDEFLESCPESRFGTTN